MKITYKKLVELGACLRILSWFKRSFDEHQTINFKQFCECKNIRWIEFLLVADANFQTVENLQLYFNLVPMNQRFIRFFRLINKV